jgi:hypothetical protein
MAQSKKYAGLLDLVCLDEIPRARTVTDVLPDKDQAPEIYETPDLTDDGSTNQVRQNLRWAGKILTGTFPDRYRANLITFAFGGGRPK